MGLLLTVRNAKISDRLETDHSSGSGEGGERSTKKKVIASNF